MWKSISAAPRVLGILRSPNIVLKKRTFLSESYRCRDAWENRLKSPLLSKVNIPALYNELDHQFSHFGRASAIDVDVFLNAVDGIRYIDVVEDVIHKLRLSPDTGSTLPSTHHAAIRVLLGNGNKGTLLKILNNRLDYGIFPDHYCCNLLMDTFLKEKDYAAAARIGVSQMLQEDWEDCLTTRLSVYSCHMYLRNAENCSWLTEEEIVATVPEPKEVVKVRVKYIREPYFDDHFDLQDAKMLTGKTLAMFGPKMGANEMIATSYTLLGKTLHKKWEEVLLLAERIDPQFVHREAITLARKSLQEKKPEQDENTEKAASKSKPGEEEARKKGEEFKNLEQEMKQKVDDALVRLEANSNSEDLLLAMEALVKESVAKNEMQDILEFEQAVKHWDEGRVLALKQQDAEVRKNETLKRIEQEKLDLIKEEQEIFFFDNEQTLDLLIEERELKLAELEAESGVKKESEKAKKERLEAAYIPPEVIKRRPTSQ